MTRSIFDFPDEDKGIHNKLKKLHSKSVKKLKAILQDKTPSTKPLPPVNTKSTVSNPIYIRRINKEDLCERKGCMNRAKYLVDKLMKDGSRQPRKLCLEHCKHKEDRIAYVRCINCGCYCHTNK